MSRLFALAARERPISARFWLAEAGDSLLVQGQRQPDGAGLGWFDEADGGESRWLRDPIAAWRDTSFVDLADGLEARRFIAHVRFASTGSVDVSNTHPFELDERLFAHHGVVGGLDELRRYLGADAAQVMGDTDSELTFALIAREIRRADGDIAAGIERAAHWIADNLPVYSWNFVLATRDELYAFRWPDVHELWWLDRAAGGHPDQDNRHFDGVASRDPLCVTSTDLAECSAVLVASEPMDDHPGWTPLASGDLLHVDQHGDVSIRTILDRQPMRALTLADLDGAAATSQAGATGPSLN